MTDNIIEEAILLTSREATMAERNLAGILDFFGLSWSSNATGEFVPPEKRHQNIRLFFSTDKFLQLAEELENSEEARERWQENIHSAFVYWDGEATSLEKITELLGSKVATLRRDSGKDHPGYLLVAGDPELCGAMAGISVKAASAPLTLLDPSFRGDARNVITIEEGAVCAMVKYRGVEIFLTTSSEIVDLEMELASGNFDIREHALSSLPVVLYLKWAFPRTCWRSPETNACLIIDDPLLKKSHGFVDFSRLLSLMKQHHFSTNIAFIPWNWRRSDPSVVKLFLEHPEHYSISVHGCDHTRAEFGDEDVQQSRARIERAVSRMSCHEAKTGLPHDRVMVFPQGVFSSTAMRALKQSDLIAAVNNDTLSADSSPPPINIRDVWDVAVMKYSGYPLFTRRYPWEGLENFAFDALLGKPVIIVIHHNDCSDGCQRLVEFIEKLNHSHVAPVWRNLSELVRRSYRERQLPDGRIEVEMYATEMELENHSAEAASISLRREESAPTSIQEIRAGSEPAAWTASGGGILFGVTIAAGETALVKIVFKKDISSRAETNDSWAEARIMLRRYLCEVRDNYVAKGRMIFSSALGRKEDKWL